MNAMRLPWAPGRGDSSTRRTPRASQRRQAPVEIIGTRTRRGAGPDRAAPETRNRRLGVERLDQLERASPSETNEPRRARRETGTSIGRPRAIGAKRLAPGGDSDAAPDRRPRCPRGRRHCAAGPSWHGCALRFAHAPPFGNARRGHRSPLKPLDRVDDRSDAAFQSVATVAQRREGTTPVPARHRAHSDAFERATVRSAPSRSRLVHDEDVANLHEAGFHGLDVVAGARHERPRPTHRRTGRCRSRPGRRRRSR